VKNPLLFAAAVAFIGAAPPPGSVLTTAPTPPATASPADSASPSPPPDNRKGLDGVWEIQIQPPNGNVEYRHFRIVQSGTAITGTYLDQNGKKYPLTGAVDGQSVRIVVSRPDGSTILLEGRVDGTTDMLGMFTDAKQDVPFTAAYRPKERWSDNVNAAPGGLGGLSSGGGPGTPGGP
jgi:hypothetical protein